MSKLKLKLMERENKT